MPDKPLTVITYAASASLAAAALVYFFTPNYLIDGRDSSRSSTMPSIRSQKQGTVVGLANPGNDCFINSILQALAGLREVRLYLIRELHRRRLDEDVYKQVPEKDKSGKPVNARKLIGLQKGDVTHGLKDFLDRLNEKPLARKTISAAPFILVLEKAFGTRISKAQQDAQEFLQVVAERVSDEYHAGKEARQRAKQHARSDSAPAVPPPAISLDQAASPALELPPDDDPERSSSLNEDAIKATKAAEENEVGFPLEGRTESQIECLHCGFIPRPTPMSFVMLNLPLLQKKEVTLDACFDSFLKVEYIDDYKCDRCRLQHAIESYEKESKRARSEKEQHTIQSKIQKLQTAIETDPERPPPDVELPSHKLAPTRRIARSVRIIDFPQVLVIHLSRSIFSGHTTTKNNAKVSFGEKLALGGLQHRRKYRLLSVISHKGQHNSGHYETFRRQQVHPPVLHPSPESDVGPYSRSQTPVVPQDSKPTSPGSPEQAVSPPPSAGNSSLSKSVTAPSTAVESTDAEPSSLTASNTTAISSPTSSTNLSTQPSAHSLVASSKPAPPQLTTTPAPAQPNSRVTLSTTTNGTATNGTAKKGAITTGTNSPSPSSPRVSVDQGTARPKRPSSVPVRRSSRIHEKRTPNKLHLMGKKERTPPEEKWWRMSDEKVKECKTADVLGMHKEVYLLFYEMEQD